MKFIRDIIAEKTSHLVPEPVQTEPLVGPETQAPPDPAADPVQEEQFDLLAEPEEEDAAPDSCDGPQEPALLFDDVWAESNSDPADFDFSAGAETPGTKADAVMRAMYPEDEAEPANMATDPPQEGAVHDTDTGAPASPFERILQRETALPPADASTSEPEPEPEPEPGSGPEPGAGPGPELAETEDTPTPPAPVEMVSVPAPEAGRARKKAGRVKTRLLGFGNDFGPEPDLFAAGDRSEPAPQTSFPVGWMVVTAGPGRGTAFTLFNGVSQIGRGEGQAVRLDFGDISISRSNHAAIAYDPEQQKFYLGHGGKANLVRLNGNPVLSTEPLNDGAEIRLGETTLRFVGLCGADFDWGKTPDGDAEDARFG